MWGRSQTGRAAAIAAGILLLTACAGQPAAVPTIGSPTPTPSQSSLASDRPAELARTWDLTGAPLPADWPDIPLPKGTEVVTAYAIGNEPRRTWTATFSTDQGTALDLAEPVVEALRERGYIPIAEYVGAAETNTGLYSFAAPTFAVYVVLGEDNDRPNVVITVRGTTDEQAGLPSASAGMGSGGSMPPSSSVPTGTSSNLEAPTPTDQDVTPRAPSGAPAP